MPGVCSITNSKCLGFVGLLTVASSVCWLINSRKCLAFVWIINRRKCLVFL